MVVFFLILGEFLVYVLFFPLVYAFGIPVLRMRVNIPRPGGGFQPDGREIQLPSGVAMRIAEDRLLFRRRVWSMGGAFFPVMGTIRWNSSGALVWGRIPALLISILLAGFSFSIYHYSLSWKYLIIILSIWIFMNASAYGVEIPIVRRIIAELDQELKK